MLEPYILHDIHSSTDNIIYIRKINTTTPVLNTSIDGNKLIGMINPVLKTHNDFIIITDGVHVVQTGLVTAEVEEFFNEKIQ